MKAALVVLSAVYMVGLVTYEIITLAVAGVALVIAVVSLILGADNRRDLKKLLSNQHNRTEDLVTGLEDDLRKGED